MTSGGEALGVEAAAVEAVGVEAVVAPSGLRAVRVTPREVRGGVIFVPDVPASERPAALATDRPAAPAPADALDPAVVTLVRAGFVVVVPDLAWRAALRGAIGDCLSDPEAIADLAAARELLPVGRRFVVGVGRGGLYARVAACAVLGLAGAVAFGGRISYPGVSTQRPIQPLDLLPGLSCPLQCHFDDPDPDAPPAHVDELERRLAGTSRAWQVFRYERHGQPDDTTAAARREDDARTAWGRTCSFLLHLAANGA